MLIFGLWLLMMSVICVFFCLSDMFMMLLLDVYFSRLFIMMVIIWFICSWLVWILMLEFRFNWYVILVVWSFSFIYWMCLIIRFVSVNCFFFKFRVLVCVIDSRWRLLMMWLICFSCWWISKSWLLECGKILFIIFWMCFIVVFNGVLSLWVSIVLEFLIFCLYCFSWDDILLKLLVKLVSFWGVCGFIVVCVEKFFLVICFVVFVIELNCCDSGWDIMKLKMKMKGMDVISNVRRVN